MSFYIQKKRENTQNGNVLVLIFLVVGLVAALSYAFTGSSRTSTSLLTEERQKALSYELNEYLNNVKQAAKRLKLRGCSNSEISYETPSGDNVNANAPSDESCHIYRLTGGQVEFKDLDQTFCSDGDPITNLEIGEYCDDLAYVGEHGGNRMYTPVSQISGAHQWSVANTTTGATDASDGLTNTSILTPLVDTTYPAVALCIALGGKWYMPGSSELQVLYDNRAVGVFAAITWPNRLWGSNEFSGDPTRARMKRFDNGATPHGPKTNSYNVRCFRRD
ncbi:MAG: hypothetical protein HRT94_03110 [Alphaproteobacteria bacterium]|nr:hypothetical protein [Alphaproteobacteria bacterium]